LPVLVKHGFSSTCYAVSGLLGKTNIWDEGIGIPQTPLMDEGEIRQWVAGGQEIGSHTRIGTSTCWKPTNRAAARKWCSAKPGWRPSYARSGGAFLLPLRPLRGQACRIGRTLGFATATTTQRSRCHAGMDLLQLPRVPVLRSTTLPVFWLKIATAYEDRRKK
jgi:hypothetical protein